MSEASCLYGALLGEVALVGFLVLGFESELWEPPFAPGPELAAGGLLLGLFSRAPGVSEAPGVPGVRVVAAAAGGVAWPHVPIGAHSARDSTVIVTIRLYMVGTVHQAPGQV
jgi:hypothetical protein